MRNRKYFFILFLILFFLISILVFLFFQRQDHRNSQGGISSKSAPVVKDSDVSSDISSDISVSVDQKVNDTMAMMSLPEKVGQLFMITPESLTDVGTVIQAGPKTQERLSQYPVGGLIYFSRNIQNPEQLTSMIAASQSYSKIPLFIGIDEEGGSLVARIGNHPNFQVETFPDMADIGASQDPSKAYQVGASIGSYLHGLGFNMDFAPDADVLSNPDNTAIGRRSFGSDPVLVGKMVAEAVKGFQSQNIRAVIKHFPGHGGTIADSHNGSAIVEQTLEELRANELIPFQDGIAAGTSGVMVGHLQVPNVTGDDTPASLSPVMVTDILRNELGFQGLVITDSLSMGAITDHYASSEAAVKAILAGVDILLMPQDFQSAYQAVLDAVDSGQISVERIDESVRRILTAKYT